MSKTVSLWKHSCVSVFQINVMQKELIELKPQLIQTSEETEELIAIIEKERIEVHQVKDVVEVDEKAAAQAAAEAKAIKVGDISEIDNTDMEKSIVIIKN